MDPYHIGLPIPDIFANREQYIRSVDFLFFVLCKDKLNKILRKFDLN